MQQFRGMPVPPEDTAWFLDQVRCEQSRLRAFIRSLGVRAEAVDDLAQDALVLAFQKLPEFDREQEFGAWIRGIARRLVANARRKEGRREQILSDHLTDFLLEADAPHPLVDGGDERLAALNACVQRLPESSRQLLHWRYFEDLAVGMIAIRLDRTANDVRQILFRLRRTLLECVERKLSLERG